MERQGELFLYRFHGDFRAFMEERPRGADHYDMGSAALGTVRKTINPKPGSGIGR